MSPEQVEGKPADMRSDIYAYGLILYEMVDRRRAVYRRIHAEGDVSALQERPKSPKTLNPSTSRLGSCGHHALP